MARLLEGSPVARSIVDELASRSTALQAQGVRPTLATIRVGERADDVTYERGLLKRCEKAGVEVRRVMLTDDCGQDELAKAINGVNADDTIHGCLLFRPLPDQLDEVSACASIDPSKDVDCATGVSLGSVFTGGAVGFPPCTAEACIALLDYYGCPIEGAHVVVVGRSLVIGRPVSMMLQARNATVTMCHTHTRDLAAICRAADLLVVATGHAGTIGAREVTARQTVIDVGINWDASAGRLCGDVRFEEVEPIVTAISPVPGGVGSVTTAILARHVVEAAERHVRTKDTRIF